MSSHHIIRDNQEPALLLENPYADTELLMQLLEWSPLLLVAPAATTFVLASGIKADAVFYLPGQKDALQQQFAHQFPLELLLLERQEDLLPAAELYLARKKQPALSIYTADEQLSEHLRASSSLQLNFITNTSRTVSIRRNKLVKWMPVARRFRIRTMETPVDVQGQVEVENESMYNTLQEGEVSFSSAGPFYLQEFF
jgi:hypothetical protein